MYSLTALHGEGITLLPLVEKRPIVAWRHLKDYPFNPGPQQALLSEFKGHEEWGIVTGVASKLTVVDHDMPLSNVTLSRHRKYDPHTETPSGGRHYFYRHDGPYQFGINVEPQIDLPMIVKLYKHPEFINRSPPQYPQSYVGHVRHKPNTFTAPMNPSYDAIKGCYFISWFLDQRDRDSWDGRYAAARAFASNVIHTKDPDTRLGNHYRHEEDIYERLGPPLNCTTFYSQFPCPALDTKTGRCTKNGACSPYTYACITSEERRDAN